MNKNRSRSPAWKSQKGKTPAAPKNVVPQKAPAAGPAMAADTGSAVWQIEPRDTLVLRDGRPVEEGSGEMRSLGFPWPSTVTGLIRTRIGLDGNGAFTLSPDEARKIAVKGPFLIESLAAGRQEWLFPAPRDCVFLASTCGAMRRFRLAPEEKPPGADTDLETGLLIAPVADIPREKPVAGPPFWRWTELEKWLTASPDQDVVSKLGAAALNKESRVHVAIDPASQTATEGMLYSTEEIRFVQEAAPGTSGTRRFALGVHCPDSRLRPGTVCLGGERRLSFLTPCATALPPLPPALGQSRGPRFRVLLLTPAIFAEGAIPAQISGAKVVAAATGRPQVISGWDWELGPDGKQKGPKATRRMAPAGSVYWVDLPVETDSAEWIQRVWFSPISTAEQDCRDGFGVAVVGVA